MGLQELRALLQRATPKPPRAPARLTGGYYQKANVTGQKFLFTKGGASVKMHNRFAKPSCMFGGTSSLVILVAASLVALPVSPQDKDAGPLLRATTRIVKISVVVTDANGQPVTNLSENDFTVFDDGHPQQITFFSPIDNSVPVSAAVPLAPNTYTNNPESKGDPPSVTILLFDTLNSKWTSQGYGLNRVRDFLRQIQREDHIGVYVLGDDLIALHRFQPERTGFDRGHASLRPSARPGRHKTSCRGGRESEG
jgi:hypothetical protein